MDYLNEEDVERMPAFPQRFPVHTIIYSVRRTLGSNDQRQQIKLNNGKS